MSDLILLDPMFRLPFLVGLLLAVSLSLLGAYLRMREEWLAALGLSHMAAAGGIAALPLGLPTLSGALVFAAVAALIKGLLTRASNNHYGLMLLFGWGGALMLAANTHQGVVVGEALLRGQLYFTSLPHLIAGGILFLVLMASLHWLSPRLLTERFFPDFYSANRIPAWPHRLLFGALVVLGAVLGTLAMGAIPAFALFFIPAWVAFVLVRGWRKALLLTVAIAVAVYVLAFILSMALDQPFGPTLTLCLALTAGLRLFASRAARLSGAPGE